MESRLPFQTHFRNAHAITSGTANRPLVIASFFSFSQIVACWRQPQQVPAVEKLLYHTDIWNGRAQLQYTTGRQ